jgi:hypothetical protein
VNRQRILALTSFFDFPQARIASVNTLVSLLAKSNRSKDSPDFIQRETPKSEIESGADYRLYWLFKQAKNDFIGPFSCP